MAELEGDLKEKYRLYALHFENGMHKNMLLLHVGRPMGLKGFCENYIFQHMELTVEKTGAKWTTSQIVGIQKIPNGNKPDFELTYEGLLKDII